MTLDIVIVNWNSGRQLADCIDSIKAHSGGLVGKCIVVDNGSTDGSTDFLDGADDVDLVRAGRNLGFGRACNLGARRGNSPFILLLNPDACLLQDCLARAVAAFDAPENDRVGIVGVQLLDEKGVIQRTCARAPTPAHLVAKSFGVTAVLKSADLHMLEWDHKETRVVDHVIGAFYLTRRSLFDDLGGFDERFFVYLEDIDFSRRAALSGYRSLYLASAHAFHKGGGVSEQVKAHRLFYSLRSRIQYAAKHFSRPGAAMVAASTLLIEPFSRLSLLMLTGRWSELGDLVAGYRMLWTWFLSRSSS